MFRSVQTKRCVSVKEDLIPKTVVRPVRDNGWSNFCLKLNGVGGGWGAENGRNKIEKGLRMNQVGRYRAQGYFGVVCGLSGFCVDFHKRSVTVKSTLFGFCQSCQHIGSCQLCSEDPNPIILLLLYFTLWWLFVLIAEG